MGSKKLLQKMQVSLMNRVKDTKRGLKKTVPEDFAKALEEQISADANKSGEKDIEVVAVDDHVLVSDRLLLLEMELGSDKRQPSGTVTFAKRNLRKRDYGSKS